MTDIRLPRLLNADFSEATRLHPVTASISERLKPPSTASIALPPDEDVPFRGMVEMHTHEGSAGIYIAKSTTGNYATENRVELEHGIVTLEDDIIEGEGTLTGTKRQVIEQILARQAVRHWVLGACDGESDAVTYDYNSTNLLAALIDAAGKDTEYGLFFDMAAHPWTVHVRRLTSTVQAEGRLSRNVRSASTTLDEDELCTRVYCARLEGDSKYVEGPTIGKWGRITREIDASEGVIQDSLRQFIADYLEANKDPNISVDIDADDLSGITGEPLDSFRMGALFRLAIPKHKTTVVERIIGRDFQRPYDEKCRVRLMLANSKKTITSTIRYLENSFSGGASSGRVSGGYLSSRGGGGGVSQQTILDSLIKTDEFTSATEAWKKESGVRIEANATEIFATKQAITGGFGGDLETVNAIIKATSDNGGLAQMLVGRKNSLEEVIAGLQVAGAGGGMVTMGVHNAFVEDAGQKFTDVGIRIDGANAEIALKANQTTVDDLGTRVSSAEIAINGANAEIALKVNKNGVISAINLSSEEARIAASKIVLDGYVTGSELDFVNAKFDNMFNGTATAAKMVVTNLSALSMTIGGNKCAWRSIEVVTGVSANMSGKFNVMLHPSGASRAVNYVRSINRDTETIYYLGWE